MRGDVMLGIAVFAFLVAVAWEVGTRVGLTDEDLDKVNIFPPVAVELLERLDRADGGRSGNGPEAEQGGAVMSFAETNGPATNARQLKVGRCEARGDPALVEGLVDIE
jgi:hypothetical protein